MVDCLNGQKRENGLNGLNGTKINSIKRAKQLFKRLFRRTRGNLVQFCMDKFVYLSLLLYS